MPMDSTETPIKVLYFVRYFLIEGPIRRARNPGIAQRQRAARAELSPRSAIERVLAGAQVFAVNKRHSHPEETEFRLHSRIPKPLSRAQPW